MSLLSQTRLLVAALIAALPIVGTVAWTQSRDKELSLTPHVSPLADATVDQCVVTEQDDGVFYVGCGGFF